MWNATFIICWTFKYICFYFWNQYAIPFTDLSLDTMVSSILMIEVCICLIIGKLLTLIFQNFPIFFCIFKFSRWTLEFGLPSSGSKICWIFIGSHLIYIITYGELTFILSHSIHEWRMSFHLLKSAFVPFWYILKLSSYRLCTLSLSLCLSILYFSML